MDDTMVSKDTLASMVDDYVNSYRRMIDLLSSIGKYKLGPIIDELRSVHVAGSYSLIARELGIHEDKLRKFIKKASKLGLKFTIDIDLSTIGLMELGIFIESIVEITQIPYISWIKTYVTTHNPIGTMMLYYIPASRRMLVDLIREEFKEKIITKNKPPPQIRAYLIYKSMRSQPDFTINPIDKFLRVKWEELIKELDELNYKTGIKESRIYWQNIKYSDPIDIIDLIILKELELNAFTTINQLAKKYPFAMRVFSKHLNLHIIKRNCINGIFLKTSFTNRLIDSYHLVILRTNDMDKAALLIKYFKYKPWVYAIKWGHELLNFGKERDELRPGNFVVIVSIAIPSIYHLYFAKLLFRLKELGLANSIEILSYDTISSKKWGIPYKFYSQAERTWTLDIEENISVLERRIFRYIR